VGDRGGDYDMSPKIIQLDTGRVIRVVNGLQSGYCCDITMDPITQKPIRSVSRIASEIFVDYVHVIAFPFGYPQIPGRPIGTYHNEHLWITGKGFKDKVDSIVIGGLSCTDFVYATNCEFYEGGSDPVYLDGSAMQFILPTGLAKGDYTVAVTIDGKVYNPTHRSINIQFHVKDSTYPDYWQWVFNTATPPNISAIINNFERTWVYSYDLSNRLWRTIEPTFGDFWDITW
jgi:hypothetical protein